MGKNLLERQTPTRNVFYFLEAPAASCLVVDALVWITPLIQNADDWFWQSEEDRNAFGSFVAHVWDNHWAAVKENPPALEGYENLIAKLAAHQNPVALEISSRMAGGR
jgi:hypothetical protein